MRLRLDLSYDGTAFSGWARQAGLRTVAQVLQDGLEKVMRQPPGSLELGVAGRTDAGVHATGQVAQVDVPEQAWLATVGRSDLTPGEATVKRLAGVLPRDVRVHCAQVAPPGFDARFAAIWRRYAYRICDRPEGAPPLRRFDVLDVKPSPQVLDLDAMNRASAALAGLNDFAAFCKKREGATTIRTLLEYSWARDESGFAVATVRADAFCHSMVRALVGALLPVGLGKRDEQWPAQVLLGGVRHSGVSVVGPQGLTLEEVGYPDADGLAQRVLEARRRRDGEHLCP